MGSSFATLLTRLATGRAISTPEAIWPALVRAATFDAMKRDGETLIPHAAAAWAGGHEGFLHAGRNERWREALSEADVALYRRRAQADLPGALGRWLAAGRLGSADPSVTADLRSRTRHGLPLRV